jgi:osmotically-inducible protein OsmY
LTVAIGPHGRTGGELARLAAEAFERTVEGLGRPVRGGVEVTEQGLARLHGNCSTAADRRALIEAVSAVPGLRDVDASDLRVAWFGTADDIRLGNIAETALIRTDPELGTIRVDVRDRTAHVRGNVREEQDRRRAIQVIEGVAGITRVIDRIRVYHAGERSSDEAAVEQRIKQALGQAGLPVPIIAVFVTSGIATLLGTVDDVDQRTRAIEVTRRVEGVSQVDCELVIASAHGRTKRAPNDIPRHPRRT